MPMFPRSSKQMHSLLIAGYGFTQYPARELNVIKCKTFRSHGGEHVPWPPTISRSERNWLLRREHRAEGEKRPGSGLRYARSSISIYRELLCKMELLRGHLSSEGCVSIGSTVRAAAIVVELVRDLKTKILVFY